MIVRGILHNHKLLDNFDWFNDYKDTRDWLRHGGHVELLAKLEAGMSKYLDLRKTP